jgi:hypothetical protein
VCYYYQIQKLRKDSSKTDVPFEHKNFTMVVVFESTTRRSRRSEPISNIQGSLSTCQRALLSSTPAGKEASARRPIAVACVAKNLQFNRARRLDSRPWQRGGHSILASMAGLGLVSLAPQAANNSSSRKVFHGAADSHLQHLRNPYAMETIMGGRACAKRSWNSRAAGRTESRREKQFYQSVCLLEVDGLLLCAALMALQVLWPVSGDERLWACLLRYPRPSSEGAAQGGIVP